MVTLSKTLIAVALVAALSSCASGDCSLPKEWVLARSMEPMPTPGSYKPILYAQETEQGQWQWMFYFNRLRQSRSTSGNYQRLLREVAIATELNPQPLLLFNFAASDTCGKLRKARKGIVRAGKCSEHGVPCIEGTLAALLATG